ncbi:glycosyltransferase family 52 [Vibrio breoganii]
MDKVESHIILFTDYQELDTNKFSTDSLPENIKVYFAERKQFKKQLNNSLWGKIALILSNQNFNCTSNIKLHLKNFISSKIDSPINTDFDKLFVFNERNKMSRLFRLIFTEYNMIEDGVGNYLKISVPTLKKPFRALKNLPVSYWVFGEDRNCKCIYALNPEQLPDLVVNKGKKIDFINKNIDYNFLLKLFKVENNIEDLDFILATQPRSKRWLPNLKDEDLYLKVYEKIINHKFTNRKMAIKPHPSEDLKLYTCRFSKINILPTDIPLELFLLASKSKVRVISLNSTAGKGFEDYCDRSTMFADGDMEGFVRVISKWDDEPTLIEQDIDYFLSNFKPFVYSV